VTYTLLPFRFSRFTENEIFVTNEVGEFMFVSRDDLTSLVRHELRPESEVFLNLKAKQIVTDTEMEPVVGMLATKYRTKKAFLDNFTALHMVVPTLRCNSNCRYCQVSRKDVNAVGVDMNKPTAKKTVDLIFKSPSKSVKIEFQGGEPLLNFKLVKYIIEYAEWKNLFAKKRLEFVICTNLTLIDEAMLKYLRKHHAYISTSLDGPKVLHNRNRPLQITENSYDILIDKIGLCRKYLGHDGVAALMTTTRFSLDCFKGIIDEYIARGFTEIFLRALNPYGFAKREADSIGYSMDDFVTKYLEALDYIIDINLQGQYFMEAFAALILTRILTPFSTGFVDMQSPAGVAISGVVYDYNGNVYVSDEARMLAATGDHQFLMGNVHNHTYQELFNSEFMHSLISSACLESLPQCSECAYQSFCGADPVRNYSEQGDVIGHCSRSDVCKRNKRIIHHLLQLIKRKDKGIDDVLWSWIARKPLSSHRRDEPCYI
jgi:uncharacterized protein